MKKISILCAGLCLSLFAMSQNEMKTEMNNATYFGIKAGANLAEFRTHGYTPKPDVNMKTSLAGGFFANIPLGTGKLHFQPELLYNGVGSKIKSTVGGTSVTSEQDLGYLSLPLMFQLRAKTSGFFVELGPQASYLIRAKSEVGNTDTDNKDGFDKFDLGLNGGLGYISRVGLGVTARYTLGLTNTLDDGGGGNSANDGPELKNSVINIGLVYMFGAHK